MEATDDDLIAELRKKASAAALSSSVNERSRPPVSRETAARVETLLGFGIDSLMMRVYLEVSDGGIGPGHGSLPLTGRETLSSVYSSFRLGAWPDKLLPVWDWGGATWSCVNVEGQIVTHDDVVGPTLTNFTTRSWLRAWVEGVDLWKELYEDREATIMNPFTRKPVATRIRGSAKGRPWQGG